MQVAQLHVEIEDVDDNDRDGNDHCDEDDRSIKSTNDFGYPKRIPGSSRSIFLKFLEIIGFC